jgi:hypothetical protein
MLVVNACQLAPVAQLVRALHWNRRAAILSHYHTKNTNKKNNLVTWILKKCSKKMTQITRIPSNNANAMAENVSKVP